MKRKPSDYPPLKPKTILKRKPSDYPPLNLETFPTTDTPTRGNENPPNSPQKLFQHQIHPPDETKTLRLSSPESRNYSNIRYTHQMKRKPSDYPPLNPETIPTSDTPTR